MNERQSVSEEDQRRNRLRQLLDEVEDASALSPLVSTIAAVLAAAMAVIASLLDESIELLASALALATLGTGVFSAERVRDAVRQRIPTRALSWADAAWEEEVGRGGSNDGVVA